MRSVVWGLESPLTLLWIFPAAAELPLKGQGVEAKEVRARGHRQAQAVAPAATTQMECACPRSLTTTSSCLVLGKEQGVANPTLSKGLLALRDSQLSAVLLTQESLDWPPTSPTGPGLAGEGLTWKPERVSACPPSPSSLHPVGLALCITPRLGGKMIPWSLRGIRNRWSSHMRFTVGNMSRSREGAGRTTAAWARGWEPRECYQTKHPLPSLQTRPSPKSVSQPLPAGTWDSGLRHPQRDWGAGPQCPCSCLGHQSQLG